jgi:hypothetical protein
MQNSSPVLHRNHRRNLSNAPSICRRLRSTSLAQRRNLSKVMAGGSSKCDSLKRIRRRRRRAVVEADPDAGDHAGGVADEPGVAIVVRRAGFPRHVAEAVALQARGGAAAGHAAQQRVHDVRGTRIDDAFALLLMLEEDFASARDDARQEVRLAQRGRRGVGRLRLPQHAEAQRPPKCRCASPSR